MLSLKGEFDGNIGYFKLRNENYATTIHTTAKQFGRTNEATKSGPAEFINPQIKWHMAMAMLQLVGDRQFVPDCGWN